MPADPKRERLRTRHACLNCRKKKTRCPGEKPACSTCVRLKQSCTYMAAATQQSDRLTHLEKKIDLILNGGERRIPFEQLDQDAFVAPPASSKVPQNDKSNETTPRYSQTNRYQSQSGPSYAMKGIPSVELQQEKLEIPQSTIAKAVDLYFELFHRQPIWCFDRQDLESYSEIPSEIVWSTLELTSRFSRQRDQPGYGDSARRSIMHRITNGTVELETIESLCLLSYSAFIDGDWGQGQFYLGLGFQLCRSARIDRELTSPVENPLAAQRKKKLLWSLQSLEQFFSESEGILGTAPEVWRSFYVSTSADSAFPRDPGSSNSSDIGIWTYAAYFGWVWSRVREYVSECFHNQMTEPWRLDSMYAKVLADMTEIENQVPWCHRYDSAKFYERRADEISLNRDYWIPWIKLQFTWHTSLIVLNHPFLYIMASQHQPNLAIPNTFWRKSSELVLLHATWIVRMIDMTLEKHIKLVDPFYAHAAAIAATVHLYFCCAADPRLKQKSKTDFVKCKTFLKRFAWFSPACEALLQSLDKITEIASGSDRMDDDWAPTRIYLSIPLMWGILQFNVSPSPNMSSKPTALFHSSLTSTPASKGTEHSQTLEISVTTSPPQVMVDPATGHNASLPPYMINVSSSQDSPNGTPMRDILVPPADSLMFNTPWLWAHLSQFGDMDAAAGFEPDPAVGDGFSTWWNFGNF
ncbi:putative C6 transcription factor [Aspergillus nomiae NRRL 13137]|uniref:Putative C6 transcription factor n=1 Tax=Aspergillus nomiae NRRL (strain ATCC 15546 / NRRL 13137 / CBS 260.88 / M93) TaxID=1509407 RepID=A0A0L1JA07_ASPN3|nr:putative C6 transcription factor [Aspergillus nomiae NRRL 13137]KNG88525.1 putative C6 transcription factor [Aspergillus nomiae NRRL 13137]